MEVNFMLRIRNLEVRVPIILGGMAVEISMAPLAAAVANEGGIGLLPASGLKVKRLLEEIQLSRTLTKGAIGINIMMAVRECKTLSFAAIDEGIDLLVIGAGFIPKLLGEIITKAHEKNTPVAYIASSDKAARLAKRLGVDAVIAEGYDAGGHLGTKKTIWELLPMVVSSVSSIPVIAAGGCGTRTNLRKAIQLGSSGIQMATRFALTRDAQACVSKTWQQVILDAGSSDVIVLDNEVGGPVGMPLRVVKTPAVERLLENGVSHVPGHRPECQRGCLRKGHCAYRDSRFTKSFCIFEMLRLAKDGNMENGIFISSTQGENIKGRTEELLSVSEIINEITSDSN